MTSAHFRNAAGIGAGVAAMAATLVFSGTAVAMPNLQVQNMTIEPMNAGPGQKVTVTYMVQNAGDTDAPASRMVLYFSNDTSISPPDPELTTVDIDMLAAGAMSPSRDVEVTLPVNAATGMRYVGALVDSNDAVPESNENDNVKHVAITVLDPPDLTVMLISVVPGAQHPGGAVDVTYKLVNGGFAPAPDFVTRFYYSDGAVITTDDTPLGFESVNSLPPNLNSDSIVAHVTLPLSAMTGSGFIGAIVDPDNLLVETKEDNNTRAIPIDVIAMTCFGEDSHSVTACSGNGVCDAPDHCTCYDNWDGEYCDTQLLTDDFIVDNGPMPDAVGEDTTVSDIPANDAGFDQGTSTDAGADQGAVADIAAADQSGEDALVADDGSDTNDGGCGQSRAAPLSAALVVAFITIAALVRRRFGHALQD